MEVVNFFVVETEVVASRVVELLVVFDGAVERKAINGFGRRACNGGVPVVKMVAIMIDNESLYHVCHMHFL